MISANENNRAPTTVAITCLLESLNNVKKNIMMKSFISIPILVILTILCGASALPVTDSTEAIFTNEQKSQKYPPPKSLPSFEPFIDTDVERKAVTSNKTGYAPFVADVPIEDTIIEDMSKEELKTTEDSNSESSNSEISKRSVTELSEQNTTKFDSGLADEYSKEEELADDDLGKHTPTDGSSRQYDDNINSGTAKEPIESFIEEDIERQSPISEFPERRMMESVEDVFERAGGEVAEFADINLTPAVTTRVLTNSGTVLSRFRNNYELAPFLKQNKRTERHFFVADPKVNYARTTFII